MLKQLKRMLARKVGGSIKRKCEAMASKECISQGDLRYVKSAFGLMGAIPGLSQSLARLNDAIDEAMKAGFSESELADKDRMRRVREDILFCNKVYGFSPQEYFTYELEKLSHAGRKTFVTTRNKRGYYSKLNNQNYNLYLNKKTEMYKKFSEFYGRDALPLYDETDREAFIEFVKKHPVFIYKPSDDYGGKGITIIDSEKTTGINDTFNILTSQGAGIVEELIEQGDALAQFHPESVNTVRAVTYLNSNNEPEIQWCFLRMGMGSSHTDNASSGGLSAMIDPETGIICSIGRDWKGDVHMTHPDTGVQLMGFKMPEWDKAMELLKKVSNVIPELRLVGWDLAYSKKGWILIEGNSRPQCVSAQISSYNGKLYLLDNMMEEMKAEKNGKQ